MDAKIHFWYQTLNNYLQYLDPQVLQNHLAQGVWSLGSQPPLFNLFLGLVLQIKSQSAQVFVFSFLYFLMGLLIILGSYFLMRKLGVSNWLAWIFSCALMVFPPLIRAETWLFYPYPLEAVTILMGLGVYYFETTKKYWYYFAFCLLMMLVVLSRSLYHVIVWMLPLLAVTLAWVYYQKIPKTKKYVIAAVIFFLLGCSIYVKNYVEYKIFSSSTLQGMSMMEMTHYTPIAVKQAMVNRGQLTPLVLVQNFSAPPVYYDYYHITPPNPNTNPALYASFKSTGAPNFNNFIYAQVGRESQHDAIVLITHHPIDYLKAVVNEAYIYFSFKPYRYFDQWQSWLLPRTDSIKHLVFDVGLVFAVPVVMLALFFLALYGFCRTLFKKGWKFSTMFADASSLPLLRVYIVFNIIYVTLVSNMMEIKEGCFYRMPIDPLLFIGTAIALQVCWDKYKAKHPSSLRA